MTPADAARILDVTPDATPQQIEARFQVARATLEDRIAKAPTPGLKAKYRESLDELTAAFEVLALAADSSALPVLQRQSGKGEAQAREPRRPRRAIRNPPIQNPKPKIKNRERSLSSPPSSPWSCSARAAGGC